MKTALIAGASGLVGGYCLEALLRSEVYGQVKALVRRPLSIQHRKLKQLIIDFDEINSAELQADDIFCCLGTTIKTAGTREAFYKVDFTYVLELAKRTHKAGATQFLLVSALGADPTSKIFYNRVKGEIEKAVSQIPFKSVHIFRPSLLLGARKEFRLGEKIGIAASKVITPLMIGPLKQYRPIEARLVAYVMVGTAISKEKGVHIHESHQIAAN